MTITSARAIAPTHLKMQVSTTTTTAPVAEIFPTPTTTTAIAALRSILAEVTPGTRPYSSDSYLPAHLIEQAQAALDGNSLEARQHGFNALSTACWHVAMGEPAKALARLRRAQSHILASMEGGAA